MTQNSKIGLGLVAVIILVLIVFWYPSYKVQNIQNEQKDKLIFDDKVYKLNKLVLAHECSQVLEEAEAYLSTNADAEQIWSALGACQFDLGKFKDAKDSFQKVLALEPENVAAKNYLKQMEFKTGEIVVTGTETPFDKIEFESRMGLNFDEILTFVKATEKPSNILEYLLASYTTTNSLDNTILFLKDALKKAGMNFTFSGAKTGTIISYGNEKERKIIMLEKKNSLVKVEMNYQKLTN